MTVKEYDLKKKKKKNNIRFFKCFLFQTVHKNTNKQITKTMTSAMIRERILQNIFERKIVNNLPISFTFILNAQKNWLFEYPQHVMVENKKINF